MLCNPPVTRGDASHAYPRGDVLETLPRWLTVLWRLGLGGVAAVRPWPRPTVRERVWVAAWGWAILGGFGLVVVWAAVAFLWFAARLGLVALAVLLTFAYAVTRAVGRDAAKPAP